MAGHRRGAAGLMHARGLRQRQAAHAQRQVAVPVQQHADNEGSDSEGSSGSGEEGGQVSMLRKHNILYISCFCLRLLNSE